MSFKKRYNLALEDGLRDELSNRQSADELTANEIMEGNENESELLQSTIAMQEDQVAMEEAEDVAFELMEQVSDNESMLEQSPESVTTDVVMMSQEAYYNAVGRLGYNVNDISRVSLEHASSNIERLRLSTEGIKEFIQNLIEKIKAIMARFITWLKSLWIQLGPAYMFLTKKIGKLVEAAKNSKKESFSVNSSVAYKYIPIPYVINQGSIRYSAGRKYFNGEANLERYLNNIWSAAAAKLQDYIVDHQMQFAYWMGESLKSLIDMHLSAKAVGVDNSYKVSAYSTDGKKVHWMAYNKDGEAIFGTSGVEAVSSEEPSNKDIEFDKQDLVANLYSMEKDIKAEQRKSKMKLTTMFKAGEDAIAILERNYKRGLNTDDDTTASMSGFVEVVKVNISAYRQSISKIFPNIVIDNYTIYKNYASLYNAILKDETFDLKHAVKDPNMKMLPAM